MDDINNNFQYLKLFIEKHIVNVWDLLIYTLVSKSFKRTKLFMLKYAVNSTIIHKNQFFFSHAACRSTYPQVMVNKHTSQTEKNHCNLAWGQSVGHHSGQQRAFFILNHLKMPERIGIIYLQCLLPTVKVTIIFIEAHSAELPNTGKEYLPVEQGKQTQ